jgi:hypothetical protein
MNPCPKHEIISITEPEINSLPNQERKVQNYQQPVSTSSTEFLRKPSIINGEFNKQVPQTKNYKTSSNN